MTAAPVFIPASLYSAVDVVVVTVQVLADRCFSRVSFSGHATARRSVPNHYDDATAPHFSLQKQENVVQDAHVSNNEVHRSLNRWRYKLFCAVSKTCVLP